MARIVGAAEMLGVPAVVRPQPWNRGGRRVGDDHVSSATPRSRLPRETRDAYRRVAVPPEVSRHDSGLQPVPATGPYMITHYDIRHAVLERNPYFHEWSRGRATRRIPRSHRLAGLQETRPGCFRGRARHRRLALHVHGYRTRSRSTRSKPTTQPRSTHPPTPEPTYSILNRTRRWGTITSRGRPSPTPSTATGSAALIELGSSLVTTCQLIPPNFPGYRPYCPYNLELRTLAQKLVHRSPSYGKPVSVFSWAGPTAGRYVVELLNTLGFRARLVAVRRRTGCQ